MKRPRYVVVVAGILVVGFGLLLLHGIADSVRLALHGDVGSRFQPVYTPRRQVLSIQKGQVLLISAAGGSALLQVTRDGINTAEYRWRYKAAGSAQESRGSGFLVDDALTPGAQSSAHNVAVKAGPFVIEWSSAGNRGGYLYFDLNRMTPRVVAGDFDTYEL
jgi:hypothetical protein